VRRGTVNRVVIEFKGRRLERADVRADGFAESVVGLFEKLS
jgi:hypothetical protein